MSQDSDNAKRNTIVLLRDAFQIGLVTGPRPAVLDRGPITRPI